jgi:SHS2 domain-containing protein
MAVHRFEEHVGELRISLEARSLGDLFAEAARALAEIMGGAGAAAASPPPGPPAEVRLHAADRDALLVDWLNELIYRAETNRTIYDDIRIERISERELHASIRGFAVEDMRTPVKAATFHGLELRDQPRGLSATVVLDV